MDVEDTITRIYVEVDDFCKREFSTHPLRSRGFAPSLSDAEVLTMEVVGELQGRHDDKAIWRYFNDHGRGWFPGLCAYKTFAKHCANLTWLKQKFMAMISPPQQSDLHIIDGVPMPVCRTVRAYRSRIFKGIAAWGYCASKDEHYYGLRGHPVIAADGRVVDFIVTPANADERSTLDDIIGKIRGLLLGDKGFISQDWQHKLAENGINLQTPLRKNMPDNRPKAEVSLMMKIRRRIETAIGLLSEKFAITRIKARDIWHFTSKLTRKLIAYNFYLRFRSES